MNIPGFSMPRVSSPSSPPPWRYGASKRASSLLLPNILIIFILVLQENVFVSISGYWCIKTTLCLRFSPQQRVFPTDLPSLSRTFLFISLYSPPQMCTVAEVAACITRMTWLVSISFHHTILWTPPCPVGYLGWWFRCPPLNPTVWSFCFQGFYHPLPTSWL